MLTGVWIGRIDTNPIFASPGWVSNPVAFYEEVFPRWNVNFIPSWYTLYPSVATDKTILCSAIWRAVIYRHTIKIPWSWQVDRIASTQNQEKQDNYRTHTMQIEQKKRFCQYHLAKFPIPLYTPPTPVLTQTL